MNFAQFNIIFHLVKKSGRFDPSSLSHVCSLSSFRNLQTSLSWVLQPQPRISLIDARNQLADSVSPVCADGGATGDNRRCDSAYRSQIINPLCIYTSVFNRMRLHWEYAGLPPRSARSVLIGPLLTQNRNKKRRWKRLAIKALEGGWTEEAWDRSRM